jgi:uncharacterized protein (DUF302 family)
LQPVRYAESTQLPGASVSSLPFAETVSRLKEALLAEDLWVIHEIDPQTLMQRGGYGVLPIRQLLFFHPRYLARLLELDPMALLEVPLKIIILEMPDGTVVLRYSDVAATFARYHGLEALGAELAQTLERLLAKVSR